MRIASQLEQKIYPWAYVGDFNDILRSHEKLRSLPRSKIEMRDFRVIVDECGFMDLGYVGDKFT